jgi:hypothetical protein
MERAAKRGIWCPLPLTHKPVKVELPARPQEFVHLDVPEVVLHLRDKEARARRAWREAHADWQGTRDLLLAVERAECRERFAMYARVQARIRAHASSSSSSSTTSSTTDNSLNRAAIAELSRQLQMVKDAQNELGCTGGGVCDDDGDDDDD